jgi:hypothetical protein
VVGGVGAGHLSGHFNVLAVVPLLRFDSNERESN